MAGHSPPATTLKDYRIEISEHKMGFCTFGLAKSNITDFRLILQPEEITQTVLCGFEQVGCYFLSIPLMSVTKQCLLKLNMLMNKAGLSLRIFRHSYCGRVVQKSHSSTPKFTRPHLEHTKYTQASKAKP